MLSREALGARFIAPCLVLPQRRNHSCALEIGTFALHSLYFGRRGRPVLHNSRYAACPVVDIHSGVRRALREPRGTIALDNTGLLAGNLETKA